MAVLIFEIFSRELNHYHALNDGDTRIGRALDNDIILSDRTISPHHLNIRCTQQDCWLNNLSDENGIVMDGEKLALGEHKIFAGCLLQMGRLKIRILNPQTAVAETDKHGCTNLLSCLFYQRSVAMLLTIFTLAFFLYEINGSTTENLKFFDQMTFIFSMLLSATLLAVFLSGFARFINKHWDFLPAYIFSLILLSSIEIVEYSSGSLNYMFNSVWPARILEIANNGILMPILTFLFFTKLLRIPKVSALIFILITNSPVLFLYSKQAYQWIPHQAEFSDYPHYNSTLRAHDIRFAASIDIDTLVELGKILNPVNSVKD